MSSSGIDRRRERNRKNHQKEIQERMETLFNNLDVIQKKLGNEHPEAAYASYGIGLNYMALFEYEQAFQWFSNALVILKDAPEYPRLPIREVYKALAEVFHVQEKYHDAVPYYMEALSGYEAAYGPKDPQTGEMYYSLAICFWNTGDKKSEKEYFEKAHDAGYVPKGWTYALSFWFIRMLNKIRKD